ncbi:MAG: ParB N-terminal domain-containing protein [Clostridiales bacterium]|nr:ParB N-terminal domain-containing protein [Clostridiales bacterium]
MVSDHQTGIGESKMLTRLPLELLDEYADENIERQLGRPQPFHAYTDQALEQLAQSIKEHGVIDPITVRPCE